MRRIVSAIMLMFVFLMIFLLSISVIGLFALAIFDEEMGSTIRELVYAIAIKE